MHYTPGRTGRASERLQSQVALQYLLFGRIWCQNLATRLLWCIGLASFPCNHCSASVALWCCLLCCLFAWCLAGREPGAAPDVSQLGEERSTELSALVNNFILRRCGAQAAWWGGGAGQQCMHRRDNCHICNAAAVFERQKQQHQGALSQLGNEVCSRLSLAVLIAKAVLTLPCSPAYHSRY